MPAIATVQVEVYSACPSIVCILNYLLCTVTREKGGMFGLGGCTPNRFLQAEGGLVGLGLGLTKHSDL